MIPGDFGGGILRRLPANDLLLYQPSGRLLLPEEQLPGLYISGMGESSAGWLVEIKKNPAGRAGGIFAIWFIAPDNSDS